MAGRLFPPHVPPPPFSVDGGGTQPPSPSLWRTLSLRRVANALADITDLPRRVSFRSHSIFQILAVVGASRPLHQPPPPAPTTGHSVLVLEKHYKCRPLVSQTPISNPTLLPTQPTSLPPSTCVTGVGQSSPFSGDPSHSTSNSVTNVFRRCGHSVQLVRSQRLLHCRIHHSRSPSIILSIDHLQPDELVCVRHVPLQNARPTAVSRSIAPALGASSARLIPSTVSRQHACRRAGNSES